MNDPIEVLKLAVQLECNGECVAAIDAYETAIFLIVREMDKQTTKDLRDLYFTYAVKYFDRVEQMKNILRRKLKSNAASKNKIFTTEDKMYNHLDETDGVNSFQYKPKVTFDMLAVHSTSNSSTSMKTSKTVVSNTAIDKKSEILNDCIPKENSQTERLDELDNKGSNKSLTENNSNLVEIPDVKFIVDIKPDNAISKRSSLDSLSNNSSSTDNNVFKEQSIKNIPSVIYLDVVTSTAQISSNSKTTQDSSSEQNSNTDSLLPENNTSIETGRMKSNQTLEL